MIDNSDDGHARATGHLHIFRRVAHVNAARWIEPELADGDLQLQWMRLSPRRIVSEDAHLEKRRESKTMNLRAHSQAAAAADQAEPESTG